MLTIFDIIVIAVIVILAFFGLRRGLTSEAVKLIGIIVSVIIAVNYYTIALKLFTNIFSFSEGLQVVVSFLIVFLVTYFVIQLLGSILKRIIRALKLGWFDHIFGLLFGAIKGLVIVTCIVWIISIFPEIGLEKKLHSSLTYPLLYRIEQKVITTFSLEDDLEGFQKSLRKLFLLEE
jgi:membrane protein required for colicin V production